MASLFHYVLEQSWSLCTDWNSAVQCVGAAVSELLCSQPSLQHSKWPLDEQIAQCIVLASV